MLVPQQPPRIVTLRSELVAAYHRLVQPDASPVELEKLIVAFGDAIGRSEKRYEDYFVALSEAGEVVGALHVVRVQPGVYVIVTPRVSVEESDSIQSGLIQHAHKRALTEGATRVYVRVEADERCLARSESLRSLGFTPQNKRMEFRTPVAELPACGASPLQWAAMGTAVCPTTEDAAAILARCAEGDPDWDADDDPLELLHGFLDDPSLYTEPDCVQVASHDGREAGIVIAQTCADTGWSRITYMGVSPRCRGEGLGKWVHLQGFAMLRAQGARNYHGGTVQENGRMLNLFTRHACKHHRTVEEWMFSRPPRARPTCNEAIT